MSGADVAAEKRVNSPLFVVGVCAVAVVLGIQIVRDGLAEGLARRNPDAALTIVSSLPSALQAAALVAAGANDKGEPVNPHWDDVREKASRLLKEDPLSFSAIRLLAASEHGEGSEDRTKALMMDAATRTSRDRNVGVWVGREAAGRKDYPAALAAFDKVLRVDPARLPDVAPTLILMASDSASLPGLAALIKDAPWRTDFIRFFGQTANDVYPLRDLLALLKETDQPPTDFEARYYLDRFFAAGRYDEAYNDWVRISVPANQLDDLGYIYNASFQYPIAYAPFDWQMQAPTSTYMSVNDVEGPAPKAMSLTFLGGRIPFNGLSQPLTLQPGGYDLSFWVTSRQLVTDRGFVWRITCLPDETQVLVESDLMNQSAPWHQMTMAFTVPPDCNGQMLRLRLAARVPKEEEVKGTIEFTKFELRRAAPDEVIPPPPPPPPDLSNLPDLPELPGTTPQPDN